MKPRSTQLALTKHEEGIFLKCERTIEAGLYNFYEVGKALFLIRDLRLYRQTHRTFELYCQERWDFTARRARQQISAWQTYEIVAKPGSAPTNESQLRPLETVPRGQRASAWNEAVLSAGGPDKVTAKHVQAAAEPLRRVRSHPKPLRFTSRLCKVCAYSFSDEHHIKSRASGGRHFETIALCPNHHRFANMVQQQIRADVSNEDIELFAQRHFDVDFNSKVLPGLLDRAFEIGNVLHDTFELCTVLLP